jgi:phosphate transport system substrate-binding protein
MKSSAIWSILVCFWSMFSAPATAMRDYIDVVGSSTVFAFSTVVAERFGKSSVFRTPKIESTGSGGGLKLFCQGVGMKFPDIANSSRRIKASELDLCQQNGVHEVIEILIGFDGIVLAQSKLGVNVELTRRELYLALAKRVPNPDGSKTTIENPYKTWHDITPSLPKIKINVFGPPPTSGTRDAFSELVLDYGCHTFEWLAQMSQPQSAVKRDVKEKKALLNKQKRLCRMLREDGAYIDAGENDNLIVQKLNANPDALGLLGFSFLDQNRDRIKSAKIDGFLPSFRSISSGDYPISRPLYMYVKKAHIGMIPGVEAFIREFVSNKASGESGYLLRKGMIPLPKSQRQAIEQRMNALRPNGH